LQTNLAITKQVFLKPPNNITNYILFFAVVASLPVTSLIVIFFPTIGARVIMDRLVSVEDQKWFMKMLSELIEKHFNMSMGKDIIGHLDPQKKGRPNLIAMRNLFFGNYMSPDAAMNKKRYIEGNV